MGSRTLCGLPEDILQEIFSWLPAESLTRFKCVNKSWYASINSLLKNKEFVKKKYLRNIDNKILSSTSLVFSCFPMHGNCQICLFEHNLFRSLTVFHDHINYVTEDFHLLRLVAMFVSGALSGHCNGIICLMDKR